MNRDYGHVFDAIELFSVIVFTLEISLRVYASPELKMSRLSYLVTFYSLVDLIAVVPYYLAFFSPTVDRYDEKLRMLRILRLLKLKSAVVSIRLLGSAISSKRDALFVATFDTIVLWYVLFHVSITPIQITRISLENQCCSNAHSIMMNT